MEAMTPHRHAKLLAASGTSPASALVRRQLRLNAVHLFHPALDVPSTRARKGGWSLPCPSDAEHHEAEKGAIAARLHRQVRQGASPAADHAPSSPEEERAAAATDGARVVVFSKKLADEGSSGEESEEEIGVPLAQGLCGAQRQLAAAQSDAVAASVRVFDASNAVTDARARLTQQQRRADMFSAFAMESAEACRGCRTQGLCAVHRQAVEHTTTMKTLALAEAALASASEEAEQAGLRAEAAARRARRLRDLEQRKCDALSDEMFRLALLQSRSTGKRYGLDTDR